MANSHHTNGRQAMELKLKTLDEILLNRMMQTLLETKQRQISLKVEDLIEQGYTEDEITESMERIQKIDGRVLTSKTMPQSDLMN